MNAGGKYAGGITAVLAGGTIQNCVNRVNITLQERTDLYSVGGVIGYMTNYTDNPRVSSAAGMKLDRWRYDR